MGGAVCLFVYLLPDVEGNAIVLGTAINIWQGILLWQAEPGETPTPAHVVSQLVQA